MTQCPSMAVLWALTREGEREREEEEGRECERDGGRGMDVRTYLALLDITLYRG